MVVVICFLHKINPCPHDSVHANSNSVIETKHDHETGKTHHYIIEIHAVTRQWLQPRKVNKRESVLWLNKCPINPTSSDGAPGFKKNQ